MNDIASEFERLLGHAALKLGPTRSHSFIDQSPQYDIERSDDCGNVSRQVATRKEVHGRKMGEGRSADLALVQPSGHACREQQ